MKKAITLILLTALLVNSALLGSSCGGGADPVDKTAGTSQSETTEEISTEPVRQLEVKDFGGYNLRVLTRDDGGTGAWVTLDVTAEEENGEAINDAVYKRNQKVSEDYNITIERIPSDANTHVNLVSQSVLSGDDSYDLVLSILSNQASLSSQAYLNPLNELDYLDLEGSWWDNSGNESTKINNNNYFVMGDINITDNDSAYSTLFNKEIKGKYPDIPDLYELVKSGKWTLDKLHEYSVLVTEDVDGDNKMSWDTDRYGVIDQYEVGIALLLGSGQKFCETDSNGLITYNFNNEKIVNAFDKIYDFFADPSYQLTADSSLYSSVSNLWNVLARGGFKAGRALFFMGPTVNIRLIRDMEIDFGILPIPKVDETQSKYYSMLQSGNATAYSIPVAATDPDRTALLLEALCEGSTDTLLPAYYETTLKRKASRDSESSDMLDIIFANTCVDFSSTYTSIGISSLITNSLKATSNTFASSEAANRESYIANIEKINAAYEKQ